MLLKFLLITLLFSSLQNSEGGDDGDSGDSCADPYQFLPFLKTKNLTFSLSPLLLRTLAKYMQQKMIKQGGDHWKPPTNLV